MGPSAPPAPRVDRVVTVTTFNTIALACEEVVQLVTAYSGPYYFNLANLGPCTVYYAEDHDPFPGDPNSGVLLPGASDNGIFVCCGGGDCGSGNGGGTPPSPGLRVTAGPPCACCGCGQGADATIIVRVVRG